MKINSTLFKYCSKNYLLSVLIVVLCFFCIVSMLELMEFTRRFANAGIHVPFFKLLCLTTLKSITTIAKFFPFTIILGTIVFFTKMHSKLEMTIIKVSGISISKILKMLFINVSLISVLYITVIDFASSYSVFKVKKMVDSIKGGDAENNISITSKGVWLRDVSEHGSYIIHGASVDLENSKLFDVEIFEFDKEQIFKKSYHSPSCVFKDETIYLIDTTITTFDGAQNFEHKFSIPTTLTFPNINKMVADPNTINFWRIPKHIEMLNKVGLSSTKYKVYFMSKLSAIYQMFAFSILVMAFCINYNHRNLKRYVFKIALLIIAAFPMNFLINVFSALGESCALPLPFAMFIVPFFISISGLVLLYR